MPKCPRCFREYDHKIAILREDGVEIAYAHLDDEGGIDMCHSNEYELPRPYVYDESTHTIFKSSEVAS